jgi:hypothetical protein
LGEVDACADTAESGSDSDDTDGAALADSLLDESRRAILGSHVTSSLGNSLALRHKLGGGGGRSDFDDHSKVYVCVVVVVVNAKELVVVELGLKRSEVGVFIYHLGSGDVTATTDRDSWKVGSTSVTVLTGARQPPRRPLNMGGIQSQWL